VDYIWIGEAGKGIYRGHDHGSTSESLHFLHSLMALSATASSSNILIYAYLY